MKLRQILARDLKEWPEGARSITHEFGQGIFANMGVGYRDLRIDDSELNDVSAPMVFRDEWLDAAIQLNRETAQKPWNGEGLPPVGTVCERSFSHSTWKVTTICGHSTDGAYASFYDGDGLMGWSDSCKFRPVRAAEQIAADEREKEIAQIEHELHSVNGEVNRVKAVHLHSIGYRKQVAP